MTALAQLAPADHSAAPDLYASEVRAEVRPAWTFRLRRASSMDGLVRVRAGVIHRLLHREGRPVWLRVAQPSTDRVLFGARAADRELASWGIERMRRALGVDQDLRAFYERFRFDPLIGPSLRSRPGLRVAGRPDPFEALAWAICEQLIEYERAAAIERRIVVRLGPSCASSGLRDAPAASVLAEQAPARLAAFDLSPARALALVRVAREVQSGRVDLHAADPATGWRRLRAIRGIGSWTIQCLALHGQGRLDQIPAGDVGYLKLVGRLRSGGWAGAGSPYERATEEEVQAFFAPYAPWSGLAGLHALGGSGNAVAARRMAA